MKKKFLFSILIILILIFTLFLFRNARNIFLYNKIISIIEDSKAKVSIIDNISIMTEEFNNGQKIPSNNNQIIITNSSQCDTNNRKFAENNNINYSILNLQENIYYSIRSQDVKEIIIETAENQELYTIQLLNSIKNSNSRPTIFNTKFLKYTIEDDNLDDIETYKIKFYNKTSNPQEIVYWISKDTGLLLKTNLSFLENDNSTSFHTINYIYDLNTIHDKDLTSINLDNYSDYKIIDKR